MRLKEELEADLETARQNFHHLLDSVPEASYVHPSLVDGWTNGDVLYHITVGPPAIRFEILMIKNVPWIFKLLNNTTSKLFNWGNALFARHPKRITRQGLLKAYEAGHTGLISSLRRMNESNFAHSVIYPESFVSELSGIVTIERLYRYVRIHFAIHANQIARQGNYAEAPE